MIASFVPDAPAPKGSMERAVERQRKLHPEAVRALQALRLMAAVQHAYRSANGVYAAPEELQSAGYLDPLWPRTSPESYRVLCDVSPDSFTCHADSLNPVFPWFRVDPTLRVVFDQRQRPDSNSPSFE